MRKTLTLSAALLAFSLQAGAQYFHHIYADGMTAGNGMTTKYIGPGHLIGGFNPKVVSVVRTNVKGSFSSADDFNLLYVLTDAATGNNLEITGTKVLELSTKDGYIAMGDYHFNDGGTELYGIFYMLIKPDGTPSGAIGYMHPKLKIPLKLTAITESANSPGDIYATGVVAYDGSPRDMFAMRINAYGNLDWNYIYDFSYLEKPEAQIWTSDILESPFQKQVNIVGKGNMDGVWINLDPSNGSVQDVNFYDLGKDEGFKAVAVSSDPNEKGYVVTGTTTANEGYNQVWAMKTKTVNTSLFWSWVEIGKAPAKEQDGIDIIGRLNTSGKYEYYLAAVAHDYPTVEDNIVFKLKADGEVLATNGVFVYPFSNNQEHVESVDISNADEGKGLSLYSTFYNNASGATDLFITKAYFNGVTACNYDITGGKSVKMYPKVYAQKTWEIEKFTEAKLEIPDYFKHDDKEICYAKSVLGGSNARLAQNGISGAEVHETRIYPNPLNGAAALHISLFADTEENIAVNITDVSGRTIWHSSYTLHAGDNDLQVVPGEMATGIYDVSVVRSTGAEHHKVAVQ